MKWIFGRPDVSRADLVLIFVVCSLWSSHVIEWWILPLVLVPWVVVSVAIEMVVFGDDYVTKGRRK